MYNPLRDSANVKDALILRRYKPPANPDRSDAWTVPDDRKLNPWDLNEPDPTDKGTMGTIPGSVIECTVGDSVVVHFCNLDMRTQLIMEQRLHSLHPHGFVFKATSDGAYPLSPPDITQPVAGGAGVGPVETALWAAVPRFSGNRKKGDRVPPGGSFIYSWNTNCWPTTSNVWLYSDHSVYDMENVELGAIGIIVIHNPADTEQEVDIRNPADPTKLDPAFLPDGSPNGSPINLTCFRFPETGFYIHPHDTAGINYGIT